MWCLWAPVGKGWEWDFEVLYEEGMKVRVAISPISVDEYTLIQPVHLKERVGVVTQTRVRRAMSCQNKRSNWLWAEECSKKAKDTWPTGICLTVATLRTGNWRKPAFVHKMTKYKPSTLLLYTIELPTLGYIYISHEHNLYIISNNISYIHNICRYK